MRLLDHHNKTSTNNLVKAIQEHCHALLVAPLQHDIFQLEDLNKNLETFISEIRPLYPRCNSESLQGEVNSYLTFEVYNLHYNDKIPLISITSRKTEFVGAFRDYDNSKYGTLPGAHRYHYSSAI